LVGNPFRGSGHGAAQQPALQRNICQIGGLTGAVALAPSLVWGQESKAQLGSPATVISNPPRQWGPGAPPAI